MIMISIIVPVYNTEQYLPHCIDSILSQSFTDFELLLIDDGSTDGSGRICDAYAEKDSRIRVFHKKNGGVSSTRNLGLDEAKGEWICFVDADDWLEPQAVELLVKKQLETGADVVSGGRIAHCVDGNHEIPLKHCQTNEEMSSHMMGTYGGQYVWGRLMRRQLFEDMKIRCIEGYDFAEDRFVMTKVSYYAHGFAYVDYPIYHYERRNAVSIMTLMTSNGFSWLKAGCQEVSNYVELNSFFEDKAAVFAKRCKEWTDSIVEFHLIPSMECVMKMSSRKDYFAILELIDGYPLIHPYLNWPQEGSIRRNYCFLKSLWSWRWFRRKSIRFAKKKWEKLFGKKVL